VGLDQGRQYSPVCPSARAHFTPLPHSPPHRGKCRILILEISSHNTGVISSLLFLDMD
jgi:hypothetical protein